MEKMTEEELQAARDKWLATDPTAPHTVAIGKALVDIIPKEYGGRGLTPSKPLHHDRKVPQDEPTE